MPRVFAHDFGKRWCVHLEAGGHNTVQTIPSLSAVDKTAEERSFTHPHFTIRLRTDRLSSPDRLRKGRFLCAFLDHCHQARGLFSGLQSLRQTPFASLGTFLCSVGSHGRVVSVSHFYLLVSFLPLHNFRDSILNYIVPYFL
jgi:hypothetical protein